MNPAFTTLGAIRLLNPTAFDTAIEKAIYAAAEAVGRDVVIRGTANSFKRNTNLRKL